MIFRPLAAVATVIALFGSAPALAQGKKYDTGANDAEIRIGQTVPHSGPGSLYGVLGRAAAAYFEDVNEGGGIGGRKIKFVSLDDTYSASKTVEATRRLVEQDEVLFIFGSLGTATQSAVQKYLNTKGVPQILLNTGSGKWNDPVSNKWTTSGLPLYPTEARILASYLIEKKPDAKIAILYQNDEYGREYTNAIKKALSEAGNNAKVVLELSYNLTDPTIDTQLVNLSQSGADVFFDVSTGKATSQAIRKVAELGWKPLHIIPNTSAGRSILNAAGAQNAVGVVSTQYTMEVGSPRWKDDPEVKAFEVLRKKRMPNVDPDNTIAFAGYSQATTIVHILEQCRDELTRANVLDKATNLKGFRAPAFLPGVTYGTTPGDYTPIRTLYIGVFNGTDWDLSETPISQ